MRGIILKDFYESFCLRKNLIGMLFSFAVVTTLVIWMRDAYSYVLLVLLMMPMIGVSTLQYSMEQDEISGYDEILLTFPLTKSEIVLAKLISTWLLALLSNLLISLPLTLPYVFAYHSITIELAFGTWLGGLIFSFVMNAINAAGFFALGNKKGTVMFVVILVILAIAYIAVQIGIGIEQLLQAGSMALLGGGALLALLLNLLSYRLCLFIYTRKHT